MKIVNEVQINDHIAEVTPIGLHSFNYSRYDHIDRLTIKWTRYTPKLNSKRGRFGLRRVSKKLYSITRNLN
jgi:hypothetical protein